MVIGSMDGVCDINEASANAAIRESDSAYAKNIDLILKAAGETKRHLRSLLFQTWDLSEALQGAFLIAERSLKILYR